MILQGFPNHKDCSELEVGELCILPHMGLSLVIKTGSREDGSADEIEWISFNDTENAFKIFPENSAKSVMSYGKDWILQLIDQNIKGRYVTTPGLGTIAFDRTGPCIAASTWGDFISRRFFISLSSFDRVHLQPYFYAGAWAIWAGEEHQVAPESEPLFRYIPPKVE